MSERIIIDFDDEEDKSKKDYTGKADPEKERIVIDISEELNKIDIEQIDETYEDQLIRQKIDCFYKGGSGLNNFYESSLNFPEGIEKGFSQSFRVNLKDEFFNSTLFNNRYIILSSCTGHVYFTDRFTGYTEHKEHIKDQTFEKTGLVYSNIVFINSLKKIFRYGKTDEKIFSSEEIYETSEGAFIWSNLNRHKNLILFTDYDPLKQTAGVNLLNAENKDSAVTERNDDKFFRYEFKVSRYISDRICIAGKTAFILTDSKLLIFDIEKRAGAMTELNIKTDENSFLFYSGNRIYITTTDYELYYCDLPVNSGNFKTTGIKSNYINSTGGFGDNIFTGTMEGWKLFKSTGLKIYEFEDEYENRIESISRNILVISKSNKIVFSNLNRFQEAEGYVISSDKLNESEFINSAVISGNEIFILTRKGILESFTNDKLNIHI